MADWSRIEVEAAVADYLDMLALNYGASLLIKRNITAISLEC